MAKSKILITEDDPVTALFIQQMLQLLGYEVIGRATDGADALRSIRESLPDLVLMDISLPGEMDGIATANQVMEQYNIPVIYVTGNVDDDTMRRAIDSNTYGYILKPIRTEQLYTMIEMGLHRNRLEKKLVQSENSLRLLNERLEEKVEERTRELRVNNHTLELEIERRKQIEENLKESLGREKELGELKSRVVSIISHELKTPLTTILSSAQLIEFHADNQAPSDKVIHHTRMIEKSVQELTGLINDTLFLSKADAGKLNHNPGIIDVRKLVGDIIDHLSIGLARDYTIHLNELSAIPDQLMLDEQLLRAVITNLLSNAVKYSPNHNEVYVDMRFQQGELAITVKDRGIGVPKKDRKYLFELFHRASNTDNIEGTGLGLSIVKRCVEVMDGKIDFTSDLDTGSSFYVYVPTYEPNT